MIAHPQAIHFSNDNARPTAEMAMRLYRTIKQFQHNVVRDFEAITQVQEATNGDFIDDGAPAGGKPPVTKLDVAELKYVFEQIVACLETDDRLALLDQFVANSQPLY